jgi:hypothetical protein
MFKVVPVLQSNYTVPLKIEQFWSYKKAALRIRSIRMFLGLPDSNPDPIVRGMDTDPDPSIIKGKYCFVTSPWLFIFKNDVNEASKSNNRLSLMKMKWKLCVVTMNQPGIKGWRTLQLLHLLQVNQDRCHQFNLRTQIFSLEKIKIKKPSKWQFKDRFPRNVEHRYCEPGLAKLF